MGDSITRLVAFAECEAAAAIDPKFKPMLSKLDIEANSALAREGFKDLAAVREAMKLSITRIVKANQVALSHLSQLAYNERYALGDD